MQDEGEVDALLNSEWAQIGIKNSHTTNTTTTTTTTTTTATTTTFNTNINTNTVVHLKCTSITSAKQLVLPRCSTFAVSFLVQINF